jgi:hypothetical protein
MPTEQDILSDTRTCGELSCDDCNERFAAAQKVIAELQTHEPYQRLKAAIDRGMGCAGCDRCLEDIEAEIAELRRDAERLNAIQNASIVVETMGTTKPYFVVTNVRTGMMYTTPTDGTLRQCIDLAAAIDAARGQLNDKSQSPNDE